ncbi:MAG: hypothetical protein ACRD28_11620 [Acidobacteriaceae bacterium]
MPLSGEAIRMMNYADDIGTTLRRLLVVLPSLAPEERKRVHDYMLQVQPSLADVLAALEDKK